MDTVMENEIKGRFSPMEVFSIGQAAHAEGYRELTSYIRDTMMRRVREVVKIEDTLQAAREAKQEEEQDKPEPATTDDTH